MKSKFSNNTDVIKKPEPVEESLKIKLCKFCNLPLENNGKCKNNCM